MPGEVAVVVTGVEVVEGGVVVADEGLHRGQSKVSTNYHKVNLQALRIIVINVIAGSSCHASRVSGCGNLSAQHLDRQGDTLKRTPANTAALSVNGLSGVNEWDQRDQSQ